MLHLELLENQEQAKTKNTKTENNLNKGQNQIIETKKNHIKNQ
jgi:hypothetical protein